MPRQLLGGAQRRTRRRTRAADDADRLERVGRLDRAARPPRARGFAQPGQHRGDVQRLPRQRRVDARRSRRRWAAGRRGSARRRRVCGGRQRPPARCANSATSAAPRETLRTNASSSPGSSVVASCGRSASSGLSTVMVARRGSSAGSPQASNTPAGRNGVGSTSTKPLSASDFPIARRRCCAAVRPRPGGRGRQHRRNLLEPLEPQHLLDQVGGLLEVGPPTRRGRR